MTLPNVPGDYPAQRKDTAEFLGVKEQPKWIQDWTDWTAERDREGIRVPGGALTDDQLESVMGASYDYMSDYVPTEYGDIRDMFQPDQWNIMGESERRWMFRMNDMMGFVSGLTEGLTGVSEGEIVEAAGAPKQASALTFLGKGALKVMEGIGDLFVEPMERVAGTVALSLDDRLNDRTTNWYDSWRASRFYWDTSKTMAQLIGGPQTHLGMPGVDQLVKVRKWIVDPEVRERARNIPGGVEEEIHRMLQEDMGGAYMRGQLADIQRHILFDISLWADVLVGGAIPVFGVESKVTQLAKVLQRATSVPSLIGRGLKGMTSLYVDPANIIANKAILGDLLADRASLAAKIEGVEDVTGKIEGIAEGLDIGEVAGHYSQLDILDDEIIKVMETIQLMEGKAPPAMAQRIFEFTGTGRYMDNLYEAGSVAADTAAAAAKNRKAVLWKPWSWFSLTPLSKSLEIVTRVGDHGKILLSQLRNIDEVKSFVTKMDSVLKTADLGLSVHTKEGNTLRVVFKHARLKMLKHIEAYELTEDVRTFMKSAGRLLDEDLGIREYSNHVYKLGVDDALEELRQMAAKAPSSKRADLFEVQRFLGDELDNVKAWERVTELASGDAQLDLDGLKAIMLNEMIDASSDLAKTQIGLEAEGMWTKLAGAVKTAETLTFLRLNPAYPIRNLLNNELTMLARGTWGLMSAEGIDDFWRSVGWVPERLGEGFGPAETQKVFAGMVAGNLTSDAKKALAETVIGSTANPFDRFRRRVSNLNLGKLDGGVWAATVESMASRRAVTSSFASYMNDNWKFGKAVDSFEDFAKARNIDLAGLPDDIIAQAKRTVLNANGQMDLEKGFEVMPRISIRMAVDEVAEQWGKSSEDIADLIGADAMFEMQKRLEGATDMDDFSSRLYGVIDDMEQHIDEAVIRDVEVLAERAAAEAATNPEAYVVIYNQVQRDMYDMMEGGIKMVGQEADEIRKIADGDLAGVRWNRLIKGKDRYYNRNMMRVRGRFEGVLRAGRKYGLNVPEEAIKPFDDLIADTQRFHNAKDDAMKAFGKKLAAGTATDEDYATLTNTVNDLYKGLIDDTERHGKKLDDALYGVLANTRPEAIPIAKAARDTVHEMRRKMMEGIQNRYSKIQNTTDAKVKQGLHTDLDRWRLEQIKKIQVAEEEGWLTVYRQTPYGSVGDVDTEAVEIFNRHLGSDTLFQAEGGFDGRVDQILKEKGWPEAKRSDAVKMALSEAQTRSQTVGGQLEDKIIELQKSRNFMQTEDFQRANAVLRDAENAGGDWAKAVQEATAEIKAPKERERWLGMVAREATEPDVAKAARKQMVVEWRAKTPEQFRADLADGDFVILQGSTREESNFIMTQLEKEGYTSMALKHEEGHMVLVPGMNHGHAMRYSDNLTGGMIVGGQGQFTKGSKTVLPLNVLDDGPYRLEELTAGGKSFSFGFDVGEDVKPRPFVMNLDAQSGQVELVRYMDEGTTMIDPTDSRVVISQSGDLAMRRNNHADFVDRAVFAPAGMKPAGSGKLVKVRVPSHKIYDLALDPEGLVGTFTKLEGAELSKAERAVRDAGYWAFRVSDSDTPNSVHVFRHLKGEATDTLYQTAGKGVVDTSSMDAGVLSVHPVMTEDLMRKEWIRVFGVSQDEADVLMAITNARAETWGLIKGRSREQWYADKVAGFDYGEAYGRGSLASKKGFASKAERDFWMKNFKESGSVLSPKQIAELLKDEPVYTREMIQATDLMRNRLLGSGDRPLMQRDIAKAYIMSTVGQGRKDMSLNEAIRLCKQMEAEKVIGDWWRNGENTIKSMEFVGRDGKELVRIEDVFGGWMSGPEGQAFLNALDENVVDAEALMRFSNAFSGKEKQRATRWLSAFDKIAEHKGANQWFTDFRMLGQSIGHSYTRPKVDQWFEMLTDLDGIGAGKNGFMGGLLGMGHRTTLDKRAMRFFLNPQMAKNAEIKAMRIGLIDNYSYLGAENYNTIIKQIDKNIYAAMKHYGLKVPEGMNEAQAKMYFQAQLFDQVAGHSTNHKTLWNTMAFMQEGDEAIVKGSVYFMEDGRAIISAMENPDFSTAIHELAHIFRRDAFSDMLSADGKILRDWLKVKPDKVTGQLVLSRDQEERFARAFERWVREGSAPTPALETTFEQAKDWMTNIYRSVKGTPLDRRMNNDVRQMFGRMLGSDIQKNPVGMVDDTIPLGQSSRMLDNQPTLSQGLDQMWNNDGRAIANSLGESMRAQAAKPVANMDGLDDAQRATLTAYYKHARGQMADTQYAGLQYAYMKRDAALLNYQRKTYFDQAVGTLMPFQFWTTHSMYNWLMWGAERPYVLGNYMRARRLGNMYDNNMPVRFKNMVKTPLARLPFVPDWLGNLYVNPVGAALPFDMWSAPFDRVEQQGINNINRVAGGLKRKLEEGAISQTEYSQAISQREGNALWDAEMKTVLNTSGEFDPVDSLQQLMSPHAPISMAYHIARGQPEKIGPFLPVSRSIKGISAILGVGGPGGINIEAPLRGAMGLPEFDEWDDYRVERMIANLIAEGAVPVGAGTQAMISQEGPIWEEAKKKAGIEYGVSVLGSNLGVPLRAYPPGEEKSRALVDEMYKMYEKGDKDKLNQWFDENPEVKGRLALYKEPKERMQSFLVDQVWDKWHGYSSLEKKYITEALGPEFETQFLDQQTGNTENATAEQLQVWLNIMNLRGEGTESGLIPPPEVGQIAQSYYNERRRRFGPDIFDIQNDFFKLTKGGAQEAYKRAHPELKQYWDWRRDWMLRNPSVAPYLVEDEKDLPKYRSEAKLEEARAREPDLTMAEWSTVMPPEVFRLMLSVANGKEMSPELEAAVEQIAVSMGVSATHVKNNFIQSTGK